MSTQKGSYHLETFGCQMNKYDSEKLMGILAKHGMEQASGPEEADVIVLNTCSIREKAEQKVFSRIGRLVNDRKRNNGGPLIAVGGCMATFHKDEIFRRAPAVSIVFGPDSLSRLPELIDACHATGGHAIREKFIDIELDEGPVWDSPEESITPSGVSAWVGIMKGCDNNCSYCVVPSTRGSEVSRTTDSIVAEVTRLAAKGYKEINLLGQNVNSYGKTLLPQAEFSVLLQLVDSVEGIERIRFMTSHPKDLTQPLMDAMASLRKVCPSIHLPVQAGSDKVLKMMGRGYSAAEYLDRLNSLKKALPAITVSTDIMVGFPGESDDDFEETLKLMREAEFDSLYLFIYSPRPGTPAADYDGAVPREVATERFNRAKSLNYKIIKAKNQRMVGKAVEVLCEGLYTGREINSGATGATGATGAAGLKGKSWFGRTPGNSQVIFHADREIGGRTMLVSITGIRGYNLLGKVE